MHKGLENINIQKLISKVLFDKTDIEPNTKQYKCITTFECFFNLDMSIENIEINNLDCDNYTPLKISNRTAVETSTKLPVTDLEQAPLQGAVSNLHWYKQYPNMYIEFSSILGDDYPYLLRKIRAQKKRMEEKDKSINNSKYVLLINEFISSTITKEQLIQIFGEFFIQIVFTNEVLLENLQGMSV